MLKDYWPAYKECPECGKNQKTNRAYFQCKDSDCSYTEKEYIINNKRETRTKKVVKEIMEYLLTNDEEYNEPLPLLKFPKEADITHEHFISVDDHIDCFNDAGWYDPPPLHQVSIPQKALYLSNREIVEVSAHETAHVPTWKDGHGQKWFQKTLDYRRKAFNQFSSFAYEKNEEARYTLGDLKRIYRENYGYNLEDLKYDPNED